VWAGRRREKDARSGWDRGVESDGKPTVVPVMEKDLKKTIILKNIRIFAIRL
jgi:hypothetical protein